MIEHARVTRRLEWHTSDKVCALTDGERHLGHTERHGNHWIAYDGTHMDPVTRSFLVLGSFTSLAAAQQSVEQATHARCHAA